MSGIDQQSHTVHWHRIL